MYAYFHTCLLASNQPDPRTAFMIIKRLNFKLKIHKRQLAQNFHPCLSAHTSLAAKEPWSSFPLVSSSPSHHLPAPPPSQSSLCSQGCVTIPGLFPKASPQFYWMQTCTYSYGTPQGCAPPRTRRHHRTCVGQPWRWEHTWWALMQRAHRRVSASP